MSQLATQPKNDLRSFIAGDTFKQQVALSLPSHMTPDRFTRIALTAFTKTPKLLECTRESLLRCLMDCSSMGLEPDGRHAHLIPYRDNRRNVTDCTLIIDYKGIIELVRRDPKVLDVQCFTIRQNDTASWENGVVSHSFPIGGDRGAVIATYTVITWANGQRSTGEPFQKADAEKARKSSRSGESGPWKDHFDEMWKKSNIRRDSKMWSLSPEIRAALDKDDDRIDERASKPPLMVLQQPLDPMALPSTVEPEPMSAEEAEWKGGGQ